MSGIQYYQIGRIVGETTAGTVLSMEELPLDRCTFQLHMPQPTLPTATTSTK